MLFPTPEFCSMSDRSLRDRRLRVQLFEFSSLSVSSSARVPPVPVLAVRYRSLSPPASRLHVASSAVRCYDYPSSLLFTITLLPPSLSWLLTKFISPLSVSWYLVLVVWVLWSTPSGTRAAAEFVCAATSWIDHKLFRLKNCISVLLILDDDLMMT